MHLFIDGKNAVYRAAYSAESKSKAIEIMLHHMRQWYIKYRPTSVHVFWDTPRHKVWRREILPTYKDRDNNKYIKDISPLVNSMIDVLSKAFTHFGFRQYIAEDSEADDLIYAAATIIRNEPIVIVSNDSDLTQIKYKYSSNVTVYNPKTGMEVQMPEHSPSILKALVGDTADNIPGFRGIGPVKGQKLVENPKELYNFVYNTDFELFKRNLLLVDLSYCPKLLDNTFSIIDTMNKEVTFDKQKIREEMTNGSVSAIMIEYINLIAIYSNLV